MRLFRWRFRAAFSVLFTVVTLGGPRTSAEDRDPDVPGVEEDEDGLLPWNLPPEEMFDEIVFDSPRVDGTDETHRSLESCLRERIAAIDFVCQLDDAQKTKLLLAGRVQIARLLSDYESRRRRFEQIEELNVEAKRLVQDEAFAVRQSLASEPFDNGSFFAKVVRGALTPRQRRRWETLLSRTIRLTGLGFREQTAAPDTATEARFPETSFDDDELARLGELKSLECLVLESTSITDAGMTHLRGLTKLEELDLGRNRIGDRGLPNLSGLRVLKRLCLRGTQITDAGLEILGQLVTLNQLDLSGTRIDGSGLVMLAQLDSLHTLDLGGTLVTDRMLQHVGRCRRLERLSLRGTAVTDAGLAHLKNLDDIRELDLGGTQITDAGLRELTARGNLEVLDLRNTEVTDRGVSLLRDLPALRHLYLFGTEVSEEAVDGLQRPGKKEVRAWR